MNRAVIEERIQSAIRPSIVRADRALWELENPRIWKGKHDPTHPRFEIP